MLTRLKKIQALDAAENAVGSIEAAKAQFTLALERLNDSGLDLQTAFAVGDAIGQLDAALKLFRENVQDLPVG